MSETWKEHVGAAGDRRRDLMQKKEQVQKSIEELKADLKQFQKEFKERPREAQQWAKSDFASVLQAEAKIAEFEADIKKKKEEIAGIEADIKKKKEEIAGIEADIKKKKEEIAGIEAEIAGIKAEIEVEKKKKKTKETAIEKKETAIEKKETAIEKKETAIEKKEMAIKEKETAIKEKETAIEKKETAIKEKETAIEKKETAIEKKETAIEKKKETAIEAKASEAEALHYLFLIHQVEKSLQKGEQEIEELDRRIARAPNVARLEAYRGGVNPIVATEVVHESRFVKGRLKESQYTVAVVEYMEMVKGLAPVDGMPDRYVPSETLFDLCEGELGQAKHVYGGILGLEVALSLKKPLKSRSELPATIAFGVKGVASLMTVSLVPDWTISYCNGKDNNNVLAFVGEAKRSGQADMGKTYLLVHDVLCNMYNAVGAEDSAGEQDAAATAALKAYGVHVGGSCLTIIRASFKDATKSGQEVSKKDNVEFVKMEFDMAEFSSSKKACGLLVCIYAHVQEFWSTRKPRLASIPTHALHFTATSMNPDFSGQQGDDEKKGTKKETKKEKGTKKGTEKEKEKGTKTTNGEQETTPSADTLDGVFAMCRANDDTLAKHGVAIDVGVIHLVCDDARPEVALAEKNAHRRLRTGSWRGTRVVIKEIEHEGGGEPRELTALKRLRGTRGVIDVCTTVRLPYLNRTALLTPFHTTLAGHWRLKEERGGGAWEWLTSLFDQAAAALLAVCARGVAHGDVKPANMVVTARDELLLIDFGAATIGAPGGPLLTTSRVGTRGFVAPEKCRAAHKHDAVAADVFSLGASFRKLLAALPARKRSKTRQRLDEMLARMVADAPADRPSLAEVCEWRQPRESSPTQPSRASMRCKESMRSAPVVVAPVK